MEDVKLKKYIKICGVIGVVSLSVIYLMANGVGGDIKKGSLDESKVSGVKNSGEFDIYCNTNITIDNGMANIKVQNSEDNVERCQIQFIEDSTNKLLYESDIINPGYYIEEVRVFEDLEAGDYTGDIIFSIMDNENEVKSKSVVNVNIEVLEA